jgi:hypothetical protein
MTVSLTVECPVHFDRRAKGRKELCTGAEPPKPVLEPGRVPRVARLLALAHRFDGLLRRGVVENYSELARLGHVTPARISQVMTLLFLAPDIQEAILFWPRIGGGRDPFRLTDLQPIARVLDWKAQQMLWTALIAQPSPIGNSKLTR